MIKMLVTKYGGKNSSGPDLRFLLICLLGFVWFLRVEELPDAKLKHKKIEENHIEVIITKSKIDQHAERHAVYISRIKSECCPAKYLEAYLQKTKLDISNDKESQLITKLGYKISKTKEISYSSIRQIFKDYVSEITTTPEKFGLHSLRSGGASTSATKD